MTATDHIKILDRKIMQNQTQYDLDRKVTALSSNDLDRYEYLTGEDLGLKPSTVEQAKFEYSPLGKIFNKGLKEEDKKEGLLKRLKNIEDQNKATLKVVKNKIENKEEVTDFVEEPLNLEAKGLIEEIRIIQKDVNNMTYDFSDYKTFKELFRDLYYRKMTINEAERKQDKCDALVSVLNRHPAKMPKYIEAKNTLLDNVENFYKGREKNY